MAVRFTILFMLILSAAILAYLTFTYQLLTGPAYYVDAQAGGQNPIQARFRIPFTKVKARPSVLEVSMDGRGNMYEFRHLVYGVEDYRIYYYYDIHHRLRYKGVPDGYGNVELRRVSQP